MKAIFIIGVIVSGAFSAFSQKMMMLDDSLKANSEALPIKMRGGSMMKYDFGVYKTIEAKAGWIKSKSKTKFFSGVESSESKQKASAEITANDKDTAFINISVDVKSEAVRERVISFSKDRVAWEREEDPSKFSETKNLVAIITTSMDTVTWNFVYMTTFNNTSGRNTATTGVFTDGERVIEIKNITQWDNGKSPVFYSKVGFWLYLDGKVVAAVQNPMDTLQKKFVWLRNDLDEYTRLVLAAAAFVLLSFGSQAAS
jgi:hypothetical protein